MFLLVACVGGFGWCFCLLYVDVFFLCVAHTLPIKCLACLFGVVFVCCVLCCGLGVGCFLSLITRLVWCVLFFFVCGMLFVCVDL